MRIVQLAPHEWEQHAKDAHLTVFGEVISDDFERIDFALILLADDGTPYAYCTCRETDKETVYVQYGGAFPPAKGNVRIVRGYDFFLNWCKERYKRMHTLIENTNRPMLKMAAAAGLLITGVRYFKGSVMLEHGIEFQEG